MSVFGFKGRIQNPNRVDPNDAVTSILGSTDGQPLDIYNWSGILGGTGGTGGGASMKPSDRLANQKFQYELLQDAQTQQQSAAKRNALMDYYTSGGYRAGTDALMSGYDTMRGTSEAAINQQLADSLAGIGESYGTAQNLTEQGYSQLMDYLSKNQQDPYSQVQVQNVAPVQLEALGMLQNRGALSPDVLAYQQAVTSAGQSGAEQYQNLLNVLSSLTKRGGESRASEAQMARTSALAGLGEQRAGYESGLKSSASSALSQLANQIAQKKLEAQAQADAQAQALLETLAGLGVDVGALLNPQPAPPVEDFSNLPLDLSQIDFSGLNNMFGPGFGSGR
jgi:hypothetical protein